MGALKGALFKAWIEPRFCRPHSFSKMLGILASTAAPQDNANLGCTFHGMYAAYANTKRPTWHHPLLPLAKIHLILMERARRRCRFGAKSSTRNCVEGRKMLVLAPNGSLTIVQRMSLLCRPTGGAFVDVASPPNDTPQPRQICVNVAHRFMNHASFQAAILRAASSRPPSLMITPRASSIACVACPLSADQAKIFLTFDLGADNNLVCSLLHPKLLFAGAAAAFRTAKPKMC